MIIEINDTWRLASDAHQYLVQQQRGVEAPCWRTIAYCTTLPSAVNELLERDLRLVHDESLSEALDRNEALRADVQRALRPILNPIDETTETS